MFDFVNIMQIARECLEADMLDESSTSVLMKHLPGKPLRLDLDMGEISPSSVLESPFGDSTTSESSIAGAFYHRFTFLEPRVLVGTCLS